MTREMIKQIERDYWEEKADPIDMAEIFDLAIKALEPEPILDKIRAEIRSNSFYVMPQYGRTIREADVLHIIDKYKAEQEDKKP